MASHSSPGIEYITTALAATGIEGVLNGLCLVLGAISIWLLTTRSPAFKTSPRKLSVLGCLFRSPLILGSILLVVVITTHWGCSMYRMLHGMTLFANQHYPKEFFDEITHPLYVLMCGLVVTAILLTDGLLVWRLWIVSDHCIYTMTVPCLAALAFLACAIRIFVFFAMASAAVKSNSDIPGANIYSSDLAKFIGACILITFITNLYCTLAISFLIYRILVRNGTGDKKLKALMCIVIESAAIYSAFTIVCFSIYCAQSSLTVLFLDLSPGMAGISFMLINVRVGLGWDATPTATHCVSDALPRFRVSRGLSDDGSAVAHGDCCVCCFDTEKEATLLTPAEGGSRQRHLS